MKNILLDRGRFVIGCNYWASHAGTAMWTTWRPDVVENDFKRLAATGMQVLRVFPLWPDFQPIHLLASCMGEPWEYRFGEEPLPDSEAGRAGVSEAMMSRFADLVRLAEQYDLKLIVSLLAGWMSSRLFVPPALANRNVITDPVAITWQVRFVKYFVKRFKGKKPIIAWEPGNECNCMGRANRAEAWVWSAAVTDAIRAADAGRPVLSGMHSLGMKRDSAWSIQDQAELTDLLTVHPYPLFTPHCGREAINTIRSLLHATVEARLYADVGGKPCLVEEVGTLGPTISSDRVAGDYARAALFSAWAHDSRGFVWWSAFDQNHLEQAPYDWSALERELGLLRADGGVKPVGMEMKKFGQFLTSLPFATLPARLTDAVCILTEGQDQWAAAFGSFILAKQAGVEMEFQDATQPIKPAAAYFLPCLTDANSIPRRRMGQLLERVKAGAVLYLSVDNGLMSAFEEITGLEIQTRRQRAGAAQATMAGNLLLPILGATQYVTRPTRATVLGREADGNPVFTAAAYGKGMVYFLSFPMEQELVKAAGTFSGPDAKPYWSIYNTVGAAFASGRAVTKTDPQVGVTEHPLEEHRRVVVMINYSPAAVEFSFALAADWHVETVLRGKLAHGRVKLHANDASVVTIRKTSSI